MSRLRALRAFAAVIAVATVVILAWFVMARSAGQGSGVRSAKAESEAPGGTSTAATAAAAASTPTPTLVHRPVTVVGIGDSVTAGSNCDCQSFVELYAADLGAQRDVKTSVFNMGLAGGSSPQLLQRLTQPGAFRDRVADADVLVVTIGANDLFALEDTWRSGGCAATCYSPVVQSVGDNISRIVAAAQAMRPGHLATILVTSYWDVFQDGDVGTAQNGARFESWSDTLTRAENAQICDGARRAGATCVDLYAAFKGDGSQNPTSLLAADGDHPNAAGHQLIASTLLADTPSLAP